MIKKSVQPWLYALLIPTAFAPGIKQAQAQIPDGNYEIAAKTTGNVLDCEGLGTTNGTRIHLWPFLNANNQKWNLHNNGSGTYSIRTINPDNSVGRSLDCTNCSPNNGTQIELWDFWGGNCQQWTINPQPDGYYTIGSAQAKSDGTHDVLDGENCSGAQAAYVLLWSWGGGGCQQEWRFIPTTVARVPKVYIGSQNHWSDLNNNPSQWSFVRANADGFYVNFIQMLPTVGNPGALCSQTASLMTHKNALFESDSRYTGLGGFPNGGQYTIATEDQEMDELINAGFNIVYTSLNYGVDNAKLADCRTYRMPSGTSRACMRQDGPWAIGGDVTSNYGDNATIRADIARTEGTSTDGPLDLWNSNSGGMQPGSVSMVKYAHSLGKIAQVMVDPGDMPASQWLSSVQSCVRYHESNGAAPDIWGDFDYKTQVPAIPESNSDGSAANTVTGAAYWLIHHMTDPAHWARLTLPSTPGLRNSGALACSAPTTLPAAVRAAKAQTGSTPVESVEENVYVPTSRTGHGPLTASRVIDLSLHNESGWLDLAPVLCASVEDPGHAWKVAFRLDGKDITQDVRNGGFAFVNDHRLLPSASKKLQLVLTCDRPLANAKAVTVRMSLLASPTRRDKLNEILTIHGSTAAISGLVASADIARP